MVESEGSDSTVEAAADAAVEAGIEPLAEPDFDEDGFPPAAADDDPSPTSSSRNLTFSAALPSQTGKNRVYLSPEGSSHSPIKGSAWLTTRN